MLTNKFLTGSKTTTTMEIRKSASHSSCPVVLIQPAAKIGIPPVKRSYRSTQFFTGPELNTANQGAFTQRSIDTSFTTKTSSFVVMDTMKT